MLGAFSHPFLFVAVIPVIPAEVVIVVRSHDGPGAYFAVKAGGREQPFLSRGGTHIVQEGVILRVVENRFVPEVEGRRGGRGDTGGARSQRTD